MSRTLIALLVNAALAVALAGVVTSSSRAADSIDLQLTVRSIDGAVRVGYTDGGWSSRCARADCTWTGFPRDHSVTLVAEDGPRSRFHSWSGACSAYGTARTCTIRMSATVAVTARFTPWRLWVQSFGAGSITVEPYPGTAAGTPCGYACFDYADGAVVRLRAAPQDGTMMMAGWGGDCAGVSASRNCLLTLRRDSVVTASFVRRPTSSCPPGKDCAPVGTAVPFTVHVAGNGAVVAPPMRSLPELTCRSMGTSTPSGLQTCRMSRLLNEWVELRAVQLYGRRFVRWEGACRGTGVCRFYNGRYRSGPPTITAVFA